MRTWSVNNLCLLLFVSDLLLADDGDGGKELLLGVVDWQYWVCRELLNVFRTVREDVKVLRTLIGGVQKRSKSPPPLDVAVVVALLVALESSVGKVLVDNVESVRRELWEERSHGVEVFEGLARFFNSHQRELRGFYEMLDKEGGLLETILQLDNQQQQQEDPEEEEEKGLVEYYLSGGQVVVRVGSFVEHVARVARVFGGAAGGTNKQLGKLGEAVNKGCRVGRKRGQRISNAIVANEVKREFNLNSTTNNGVWSVNTAGGGWWGEFKRLGVLLKLCRRRGLQNRLFFLFGEVLGYGTRVSSAGGFRLHGLLWTRDLEVEVDSHVDLVPHSFIVNVNNGSSSSSKVLVLAAFNLKDKEGWVRDLRASIARAKANAGTTTASGLPSGSGGGGYSSSTEEMITSDDQQQQQSVQLKQQQHIIRANSVLHVCWHRNLTVTAEKVAEAQNVELSGYLLRKFKNSPGWQRLWVVYVNVCLYFYKSHHHNDNDNSSSSSSSSFVSPLASLPLLGYRVGVPGEGDGIGKDHVFKLSFKNHVYFFRAESLFTYLRWTNTLSTSTNPTASAST